MENGKVYRSFEPKVLNSCSKCLRTFVKWIHRHCFLAKPYHASIPKRCQWRGSFWAQNKNISFHNTSTFPAVACTLYIVQIARTVSCFPQFLNKWVFVVVICQLIVCYFDAPLLVPSPIFWYGFSMLVYVCAFFHSLVRLTSFAMKCHQQFFETEDQMIEFAGNGLFSITFFSYPKMCVCAMFF